MTVDVGLFNEVRDLTEDDTPIGRQCELRRFSGNHQRYGEGLLAQQVVDDSGQTIPEGDLTYTVIFSGVKDGYAMVAGYAPRLNGIHYRNEPLNFKISPRTEEQDRRSMGWVLSRYWMMV